MTHRARRNLRRIGIFFFVCFLTYALALVAATFGLRTPRWVLPVCLVCALQVAEFEVMTGLHREGASGKPLIPPVCRGNGLASSR